MRPASIAVAVLIGLIASSAARAEEFATASIKPVPLPEPKAALPAAAIKPVPLPPKKQEWTTQSASDDVIASFKHNDGSELSVICSTGQKKLLIAFELPQAKWSAGQGIDVMTLPDSGQQPSPSGGYITGPTEVVLKHDPTFDLWTMAQAKDFFKLSVGDFARVFPMANFRDAVTPVLKACGDHW